MHRLPPRPLPIAIALALALGSASLQAQPAPAPRADTPGAAREIRIAAQPLAQALNEWARQTRIQVAAPQSAVAGKTARAVSGSLNPREALERLLEGSGLRGRFEGNLVTIEPAPTPPPAAPPTEQVLQTVTVTGTATRLPSDLPKPHAGGQVARGARLGLLGNVDLMDTPFNVTAYTAELIEHQQARNIVDVLANDPSAQAGGPRSFDNFYIRGFAVNREEIGFDGLFGISSAEGNLLQGIERVEVMKGPSTLLNGSAPRGTAGGAINLVPKRADDTPLTRLTTSYLGEAHGGVHLDIGRRFGPDNAIGVRINAAYNDGRMAADHESLRSHNLTAGIDYRGERVRLSADLGSSAQRLDGARSNFFVASPTLPAAPDGKTNVWPAWTYQDKEHRFGVLRGEFDLSESVMATLAYGTATSQRRMIEAFSVLADAAGTLNASANGLHERNERRSAEASLRWRFSTAGVKHNVVLAANHFSSDLKNFQPTINYGYTSNLYRPVDAPSPGGGLLDQPLVQLGETTLNSVALTDTLGLLDGRLLLTLGVRQQKIQADAFNYATGAFESSYQRSRTTPAIAAVYKQTERLSFYANYVEALSQGATAPSTAVNANEVFPPFVSKQGEVGVKVDWGRLTTTLSAFEIRRPSGLLDASNRYSVDGEQRNRGVELQWFGELQRSLRVLGGATWTRARLTKTQGGANDGRQAAGAPQWQLKLGGEWDLAALPGLTATGRVIHTSSQPLTVDDSVRLPAWTRLDLGLRYATQWNGRPLVLRAIVENAANRRYWDSVPAFQVATYAAPRTFLLSASMDF
ncbi:TonB-dependent receptor [Paracidovorax anthurii]|uniref:Iron complex outermembrane receptor protein n=1 Tax=Paracidovorax anthurii TaxID=78229 RepID=A0A328Z4C8_9BURK|nr:TonB-dependent receptor [Paracidovorax anthurii]RAR80990.1 iron complex outermembrane receptor protein [Paracidovorax anthurii]